MPEGMSPRRATTRSQPSARYSLSNARNSSRLPPTQLMCGTPATPWVARSRCTVSGVWLRVEPPAPKVTDMNCGSSPFSRSTVRSSWLRWSSVLGG